MLKSKLIGCAYGLHLCPAEDFTLSGFNKGKGATICKKCAQIRRERYKLVKKEQNNESNRNDQQQNRLNNLI